MSNPSDFQLPWLIAVWPGMGQVAVSAGYYLISKLDMRLMAEFSPDELFDVEHVEVKDGLICPARMPRNQLFLWKDPRGQHDIIVFFGEAQPPAGKYAFCRRLIKYAQEFGVERVFTFAAMATKMHPEHDSRVFAAATDANSLAELRELELEFLENGNIGGLNGILLGAAGEAGLRGACLLGEMPHVFAQLPFPKASLAVLQAFATIAEVTIDFSELSDQANLVDQKLGELLAQVEQAIEQRTPGEEETFSEEPEEQRLSREDERRVEQLFEKAEHDRSNAYELKQELDRLDVFQEYEDRFLDLFKNPE